MTGSVSEDKYTKQSTHCKATRENIAIERNERTESKMQLLNFLAEMWNAVWERNHSIDLRYCKCEELTVMFGRYQRQYYISFALHDNAV